LRLLPVEEALFGWVGRHGGSVASGHVGGVSLQSSLAVDKVASPSVAVGGRACCATPQARSSRTRLPPLVGAGGCSSNHCTPHRVGGLGRGWMGIGDYIVVGTEAIAVAERRIRFFRPRLLIPLLGVGCCEGRFVESILPGPPLRPRQACLRFIAPLRRLLRWSYRLPVPHGQARCVAAFVPDVRLETPLLGGSLSCKWPAVVVPSTPAGMSSQPAGPRVAECMDAADLPGCWSASVASEVHPATLPRVPGLNNHPRCSLVRGALTQPVSGRAVGGIGPTFRRVPVVGQPACEHEACWSCG